MSLLGHKQFTPISMPEHKPWCHSVIMHHLLCMCHVHIKVRINFSTSEGLVSSFFNSVLIMQGSVSSAYYTHLLAQEWLHYSHYYVAVYTTLMSHACLQLFYFFLDTCSLYRWLTLSLDSLHTRSYNCAKIDMISWEISLFCLCTRSHPEKCALFQRT